MIHVVGGCYTEICLSPDVRQFYGSAGRAATAIAGRTNNVCLHTFATPRSQPKVARLAALGGFEARTQAAATEIAFGYVHPVNSASMAPSRQAITAGAVLHVEAEGLALVFGTLEGRASATADTIVYDPQDGISPITYESSGCHARKRLAILVNSGEAVALTGAGSLWNAGAALLRENAADVVVVKSGPDGALVFEPGGADPAIVPAYFSSSMFGIGSGDVFAAAFSYFWGEAGEKATVAADKASRCVSHYVSTRADRLPADDVIARYSRPVALAPGRVYLAGPFFNMAQRWLVEETREIFLRLGLSVFSPLHDVGRGPAEYVAPRDLEGLEKCDRVFAILDGLDAGTMFEIGYARKIGIPVFGYSELVDAENSKMITGSGCFLINDFASAIYRTAWRV